METTDEIHVGQVIRMIMENHNNNNLTMKKNLKNIYKIVNINDILSKANQLLSNFQLAIIGVDKEKQAIEFQIAEKITIIKKNNISLNIEIEKIIKELNNNNFEHSNSSLKGPKATKHIEEKDNIDNKFPSEDDSDESNDDIDIIANLNDPSIELEIDDGEKSIDNLDNQFKSNNDVNDIIKQVQETIDTNTTDNSNIQEKTPGKIQMLDNQLYMPSDIVCTNNESNIKNEYDKMDKLIILLTIIFLENEKINLNALKGYLLQTEIFDKETEINNFITQIKNEGYIRLQKDNENTIVLYDWRFYTEFPNFNPSLIYKKIQANVRNLIRNEEN